MKKYHWLAILAALVLALGCIGSVCAEIIPPYGLGQCGLTAAVLCEELTLREAPDSSSRAVRTLRYGQTVSVNEQAGGWAHVIIGEGEDAPQGWINADYIIIDPAWYRTEKKTPVYAWNDTAAPKIALLDVNTAGFMDRDTYLPVLKDEGDWLLVSLRGAVGWIHK